MNPNSSNNIDTDSSRSKREIDIHAIKYVVFYLSTYPFSTLHSILQTTHLSDKTKRKTHSASPRVSRTSITSHHRIRTHPSYPPLPTYSGKPIYLSILFSLSAFSASPPDHPACPMYVSFHSINQYPSNAPHQSHFSSLLF